MTARYFALCALTGACAVAVGLGGWAVADWVIAALRDTEQTA